jgi:hypothetical protein
MEISTMMADHPLLTVKVAEEGRKIVAAARHAQSAIATSPLRGISLFNPLPAMTLLTGTIATNAKDGR